MTGTTAEQKRVLLPFLQRAEEVQKVDPKVGYYCRLYAVQEGLNLENRSKEVDALLMSVMEKLELDKPGLTLNAEEDKLHLEGFALKIFDRADRVDRAGAADMTTCKAFYAASVFLEVCRQFGELDEDLESKQKYSAWKAADIRKAVREGRKPTPGCPNPESSQVIKYPIGQEVVVKSDPNADGGQELAKVLDDENGLLLVKMSKGGDTRKVPQGDVAWCFNAGDTVNYSRTAGGTHVAAKVLSMDAQHWPPSYEVETSDGAVCNTQRGNITPATSKDLPSTSAGGAPKAAVAHETVEATKGGALPSAPPQMPVDAAPTPVPAPASHATPPPKPSRQVGHGSAPSVKAMIDAQKQAKFAVSALGFEDHKSAVEYLQTALSLLGASKR